MKLYRNAIILVVIIALLGGAYYFISKSKKPADTDTTSGADIIKLIDYSSDKTKEVAITGQDGTIGIAKDKDGKNWILTSPEGIKGDSTKLSTIVTNAVSINADKLVADSASDLSQYGLDKPVDLTVKGTDGTEKTLEIGSLTPTKDAYYAMMKGSSKVYTVSSYTAEQFILKLVDVKDKALIALNQDNIIDLSMDRDGKSLFKSRKEDPNWTMTAPIEGNVNSSALSPMLTAVATITASGFEELNSTDLSKYGLDNPKYVLYFDTASEKHTLYLGAEKTKGSLIYARLDDSKDIFTLDETPFSFLDKPLKEILEVFAYITNIDTVNKVELTMDGKTTTLGLSIYKDSAGKSDADKDKFTLDGKDATGKDKNDDQPARLFYQAMIGVGLDEIDTSDAAYGTPEVTIKYYLNKAPGTMEVEFVSKDANYYYVFRNGKYAHILVRKDKADFGVQGVRDALKKAEDFVATK